MYDLTPASHRRLDVMDNASAHSVMQSHIGCRLEHCPAKRQARDHLIMAGRLTPDSARIGS